MRRFVGIDLGREPVPDETTVCRFRHLLEQHDLGTGLFEEDHRHLEASGIKVAMGTIVDATIINALSSTKNTDQARDPNAPQINASAVFLPWIRLRRSLAAISAIAVAWDSQ